MVKMETHFIKHKGLCRISEVVFRHVRWLPLFKMAHGMSCKDRARILKDNLNFREVRFRIDFRSSQFVALQEHSEHLPTRINAYRRSILMMYRQRYHNLRP